MRLLLISLRNGQLSAGAAAGCQEHNDPVGISEPAGAGGGNGLQKYSNDMARKRASIPKYQVFNNALKTVFVNKDFSQAVMDRKLWGVSLSQQSGATS
jgi:hypothetical protein